MAADRDSTRPLWAAELSVLCRDVPRLMREGFFWSAENLVPEGCHMSDSVGEDWLEDGYKHGRLWSLVDTANGDTPLWMAQLDAFAPSLEVLVGLRVRDLAAENVCLAEAWNPYHRRVYEFDYDRPDLCYNCIYEDTPLQGWWPWPKDDGISRPVVVPRKEVEEHPVPPVAVSQAEPAPSHEEEEGEPAPSHEEEKGESALSHEEEKGEPLGCVLL